MRFLGRGGSLSRALLLRLGSKLHPFTQITLTMVMLIHHINIPPPSVLLTLRMKEECGGGENEEVSKRCRETWGGDGDGKQGLGGGNLSARQLFTAVGYERQGRRGYSIPKTSSRGSRGWWERNEVSGQPFQLDSYLFRQTAGLTVGQHKLSRSILGWWGPRYTSCFVEPALAQTNFWGFPLLCWRLPFLGWAVYLASGCTSEFDYIY